MQVQVQYTDDIHWWKGEAWAYFEMILIQAGLFKWHAVNQC